MRKIAEEEIQGEEAERMRTDEEFKKLTSEQERKIYRNKLID